jgi:AcrR family transcriptional regulator
MSSKVHTKRLLCTLAPMPARGDHEERRQAVSEAVWQVLAEHGFGGLTLRAVATRMGASTGLLTHYFPTKQALVRHALELTHQNSAQRPHYTGPGPSRKTAPQGLAGLRLALLDVMPLNPETLMMSRVWVSFWDAALADPELSGAEAARYANWRNKLRPHVAAAIDLGELPADSDVDDLVVICASFAHGLVVQTLFDPALFPPGRQITLVTVFVSSLALRVKN